MKIASSVKPPAPTRLFPFGAMKVGDSFWCKDAPRCREGQTYNTVYVAAMRWRKKAGKSKVKFTIQVQRGGVRCWRVQ